MMQVSAGIIIWKKDGDYVKFFVCTPGWPACNNKGDVVLDPFVGSGTTILAALELNRKYIGFDIYNEYVDLTKKKN